jgi:hypothetical protein
MPAHLHLRAGRTEFRCTPRQGDRIFRIQSHFNFGDQSDDFGLTQFAMVPTLLQEYPGVESGSWLYVLDKCSFTYQGQSFIEDHGYYADTAFFRTFDYQWLRAGAART